MTDYRLYTLAPTGHIVRHVDLQLSSDEDAVAAGKTLVTAKPLEIWAGARGIARIDPRDDHGGPGCQ